MTGRPDQNVSTEAATDGSSVGRQIRTRDWAATPLGSPDTWPESIRGVVNNMLASAYPMYIAWGPELRLLYNDGYAEILGARHPAALGAPFREVWADVWPDVRDVIEAALTGTTSLHHNLAVTMRRNGVEEQTYFTFSTSPLVDGKEQIVGVFCVCQETTAEVEARNALEGESSRLKELFRQAPGFMAVLRGPNHVYEIVNEAYLHLIGGRDVVGKSIREGLPELYGQGFFELLDKVYATGEAFNGKNLSVQLQRSSTKPIEQIFVDFVIQPIRDRSGNVNGIFIEGVDVTLSKQMHDAVKESERFARSVIDALGDQIAVLDASGMILATNRAWGNFAAANGATPAAVSEGCNYLDVCDRAAAAGDAQAAEMAELIRDVASARRDLAVMEYPCHSPSEKRWFSVKVSRFSDDGPVRLLVAHENITERHLSDSRIEFLATHDALTGLPNRTLLNDQARQCIEKATRDGLGVAVLFIDLDNFKYLNDAHGHAVGDRILQSAARELASLVSANDIVARVGGDEFVVLLTELRNPLSDAATVARAIVDRFVYPLPLNDRDVTVTPSIGISLYPSDGGSLNELLQSADAAMYQAKNLGRARYQFFSADLSAQATYRAVMESELRRAVRREQFKLVFQPQVRIATGELVGVEALLRWQHPDLGLISPDRFIPVAEETGLIGEIGRWVLRAACAQNRAWQRSGCLAVPVAVNIPAVQLKHPDFVDMVGDVLAETGLDPKYLELEITEGLTMENTETLLGRLHELKSSGVKLAVDDFGTGYSNLGYLQAFPIDRLKIDRSFVSRVPDDPNAASIVRAIVALSQGLKLHVIAEGVETAAQANFLARIGCAFAQGFFFSVPLSAADMEARLAKSGRAAREAQSSTAA